MKKFWIFLFFIIIPFSRVHASGDFQADYTVQYAISPTGTTIVTQNITLTNNKTNLYPQKYSIVLDTTKIKNVIAYDNHQIVPTDITQKDGKTQILLTFNDKVVGQGRQLPFTLRFENGDIAQKNGNIWEVNIPGVNPDTDIQSYNVSLSVPSSFGPNAYMSPIPANGSRWTRDQMMAGGISAAYGTTQAYDVRLQYFIQNTNVTPIKTEIALPPDTAYQTVVIKSLQPKPDTIERDDDGNWLAHYSLLPGTSQSIEAVLQITVVLQPKNGYTDDPPDPAVYTSAQKFWESKDAKIADLAKTYTTPREIYDYVVETLGYDYGRVNTTPIRKGAVAALAAPGNSVCMEFADLFIAIARAAGIPARESVGYAYTTNSKLRPLSLVADVLHAWPEYYDRDKKIWIPVDPTWANTTGGVNYFDKLDYNHIVFAIRGVSGDYPLPAGFYRKTGKTSKDVTVEFAQAPGTVPEGKLTSSMSFPAVTTAGLRQNGTLTVENTAGVAITEATVIIQSTPVDVATTYNQKRIPPFGKIVLPVSILIPNYLTSGEGRFVVTVNGQSTQFPFRIQPITSYFIIPIICFGAILVILIILALQKRFVWTSHKKH